MAARYRRQGKVIPAFLSTKIGKGHEDSGMVFCSKCGGLKKSIRTESGKYEILCQCEPKEPPKDIEELPVN